jgi:hypothetical protein
MKGSETERAPALNYFGTPNPPISLERVRAENHEHCSKNQKHSASRWGSQWTGSAEASRRPAYTLTGDHCSKSENSFCHRVLFTPREQFT